MAVCSKYSIPHSTFMEWSAQDQAKAVAFLLHEAEKCSLCGTADWEWNADEGGSKHAYEPVEKICMGCYTKHGMGEDSGPGTYVTLEKTGTVESAKRFVAQKAAYQASREARASKKRSRG